MPVFGSTSTAFWGHTDAHGVLWPHCWQSTGAHSTRKGWLTREDVVNTLPLGKIEQVLAAKRLRLTTA